MLLDDDDHFFFYFLTMMTTFIKLGDSSLAKDFDEHAKLCNQLLSHYSDQYKDRLVYWAARARSSTEGDILCMIVDSFDRSKLQLPAWPLRRTPKRTVYETINSDLDQFFAEKRKTNMGIGFGHTGENAQAKQLVFKHCFSLVLPRSIIGSHGGSLPWSWMLDVSIRPGRDECW